MSTILNTDNTSQELFIAAIKTFPIEIISGGGLRAEVLMAAKPGAKEDIPALVTFKYDPQKDIFVQGSIKSYRSEIDLLDLNTVRLIAAGNKFNYILLKNKELGYTITGFIEHLRNGSLDLLLNGYNLVAVELDLTPLDTYGSSDSRLTMSDGKAKERDIAGIPGTWCDRGLSLILGSDITQNVEYMAKTENWFNNLKAAKYK